MSSINALNDIFNQGGAQINMPTTEQSYTNEFRPSYKKGVAGVYTAVIRFVPNPKDPNGKSIIRKAVTNLKDPYTNESRYIDNPSSIGKPDPIQTTFWALRNSDDAVKKEQSAVFSRRERFTSLVQVLNDPQKPDNNNKILIWSYGIKVFEKLQNEMSAMPGSAPKNPFDLVNGRAFLVKVKEKSGFPNYDECQFYDLDGGAAFRVGVPQADGTEVFQAISAQAIANEEGRNYVFNYLVSNAPDMSDYEYHEWDAETHAFVAKVIDFYMNPQVAKPASVNSQIGGASVSDMLNGKIPGLPTPAGAPMPQMPTAQPAGMPSTPVAPAGLQMGIDNVAAPAPQMPDGMPSMGAIPTTPNPAAPEAPAAPNGNPALNLDDILSTNFG